ncbi:MAG: D-tyrosyl-tRNA(Tyr) deacylase [Deltaproteobacteria bacterium]|nr:D-tyrosyl-tRNA(Tyr) deacylase [Deltaproteobacteria bacterium]
MRVLIQRVSEASVTVDSQIVGLIGQGLLVFMGAARGDDRHCADWLVEKITGLRVFPDQAGKMNLSLLDVKGAVLLISQFTLLGDLRRGRRPSFVHAADPAEAEVLYQYFGERLAEKVQVAYGLFGADMKVALVNDGPVTFWLEKTSALSGELNLGS